MHTLTHVGGLQQVFFLQHMVRVTKKSGDAIGSRAEVPQILLQNPKIWVIMVSRHFGPKTFRHYQTGAEVSFGHFGTGAELSRPP